MGDWVGLGLAKLLTKSAKSRTRLVKVRARTIMRFFFDYCQDPGPGPGPNLVLTWSYHGLVAWFLYWLKLG